MSAVIRALLGWLAGGSALAALTSVVIAVSALALGLIYRRYLGILGANRRVLVERQAYDALRNSLLEGNLASRLYTQRLTRFLDIVDRFLGDAGKAEQRAFGMRRPAPLWTASPFDRCLLLGLIYVLGTIFLLWAFFGHVGSAERALGLSSNFPFWRRGLSALALVGAVTGYWQTIRNQGWKSVGWFAVAVSGALAIALVGAGAGAVAGAVSVAGLLALVRVGLHVPAGTVAVAAAFAFAFSGAGAVIAVGAVAVPIAFLHGKAIEHRFEGGFMAIFLLIMVLVCLVAAGLLSPLETWSKTGPLLLFLGFLPLINAPFDWICLGLTRALLRRGLELGKWWPVALSLVDASLATVFVTLLALAMVIGVQIFDGLALHGGGSPVLPLDKLFDGIAAEPTTPSYWWVYALLLSTMIPSLVNLGIGATSLLAGVPGLPSFLVRFIRSGAGPTLRPFLDRLGPDCSSGCRRSLGHLGPGVPRRDGDRPRHAVLRPGVARHGRGVAAFNLPARVWQFFGVSL